MNKPSIASVVAASALTVIAVAEVSRVSRASISSAAKVTGSASSCMYAGGVTNGYEPGGVWSNANLQCYTTWSDGSRCITVQPLVNTTGTTQTPAATVGVTPALSCAFAGTGVGG